MITVAQNGKVIGRRDESARKIAPPIKEAMRALLSVADLDFSGEAGLCCGHPA